MVYTMILLAASLSLDAFALGISYGMKGIKIPLFPKILLCFSSVIYAFIGIWLGKWIIFLLGSSFANIIGILALVITGGLMLIKSKYSENIGENEEKCEVQQSHKLMEFAIKSIGITIMVIKNPIRGDIDGSGIIDLKEAFFIGIVLNLDAITACAASSMVGLSSLSLPSIVGLVQLIFIQIGLWIGKVIFDKKIFSEKLISIVPGIILVTLGLLKAFKI